MSRASSKGASLAVAAVASAAYLSSLGGGYTFDDRWVILENPIVQQASLFGIFTSAYTPGPVYRPVTLLGFAVSERLGLNPLADHIGNVLLHVLVSLLVLALARRVVRSKEACVLGALLFALHPIHTEVVANLVGRAELLAAFFGLAAMVAFARYIEAGTHRGVWLSVSLLSFAIGPFAKENALTVLPMIALLHWRLAPDTPWRRRAWVPASFLAAAVPYLAARLVLTGALTYPAAFPLADNPLAHIPSPQRIATALFIIVEYIGLLLAPISLSADYSFNQVSAITSVADARFWIAVAVLAAATAALWRVRHRSPELVFCAVFAVCTLSLTSNLAFPIGTIMGERLLYLPSVGWCLGVGIVGAWAIRRQAATKALVAAVLVLFGLRTWVRNHDWRDDASLYRATAHSAPNSAKAQYNYGTVLLDRGDLDEAAVQFRRALEIDSEYWQAAFGIGKVYEAKTIPSGALHWYAKVIRMDWRTPKAHLQTGLLRLQLGELAAAEASFRTGLSILPEDPFLLLALGSVRAAQGDPWEARELVRVYDRLAWTQPRYREAYEESRNAILDELSS